MTTTTLRNMYCHLTTEERFRLILAAAGRGDYAEREQLSQASPMLTLQVQDFKPWSDSFTEMAMIIFMELVDLATKHRESLRDWVEVSSGRDAAKAPADSGDGPAGLPDHDEMSADEKFEMQMLGTSFAIGFILKTKIAGWQLFCERMNVPAFKIWESLPGYGRLEKAMAAIDETEEHHAAAFRAEDMLGFLQKNWSAGLPEPTEEGLISADVYADGLGQMFRDGVKQHGG